MPCDKIVLVGNLIAETLCSSKQVFFIPRDSLSWQIHGIIISLEDDGRINLSKVTREKRRCLCRRHDKINKVKGSFAPTAMACLL
jgi:hypothetical protein